MLIENVWGQAIHLGLRDFCPCESGKRIEACSCLVNDRFQPPVASVTLRGPSREYRNPNCYLSGDANCSTQLSREHFVSESILKVIEFTNGGLIATGFPWQTAPKLVSPRALTSKVLCERHNNALSPLDDAALRFYKRLSNVDDHLEKPRKGRRDKVYLFSGYDLERWVLKVLCGLLVSGNAATSTGEKVTATISPDWADVLMGRCHLPAHLGLYITSQVNDVFPIENKVGFALLFGDGGVPVGALASINGIGMALVMARILSTQGTVLEHAVYRSQGFLFEGPSSRVMLLLAGNGWDGNYVQIDWQRNLRPTDSDVTKSADRDVGESRHD